MKRTGIFLAFILFFQMAFADDLISKVITLNYKSANEVMALIKPLLKSGEEMTGTGQTLVVKVSPDTLTQIRALLHNLDVAPVTFQVTIFQGPPNWLSQQDDTVYSTSNNRQQQQSQSVQVMNGQSAFVSTGQDIPVVTSVSGWGLNGPGVSYGNQHVQKGLYVMPTMQGNQVMLKVKRIRSQENSQLQNSQQFQNQNLETTVMVPLNKWVSLGSTQDAATGATNNADSESTTISVGNQFSETATLYIKVNKVGG